LDQLTFNERDIRVVVMNYGKANYRILSNDLAGRESPSR